MAIYRFLGPELVYDSIGTVRRFCAEVEEDAVRAQMEADRAVFELDPTLDEPTHAEAARMYLGLRAYLQSGGLSGYTLHYGECGEDWPFYAAAAACGVKPAGRRYATPPRAIPPPPCWWRPCRRSAARRALRKCT